MIDAKKWEEVGKNEDLVKKLLKVDDTESIQKELKANGFEFSLEEIREFGKELEKASAKTEGELNADDLENVAGGGTAGKVAGVALMITGGAGLMASAGW